MRVKLLVGVPVLLLAVGIIAGPASAGGGGGGSCQPVSSGPTLVMRDFCFEGVAHFASSGDTITVRNEGEVDHDITAIRGEFESTRVRPGELVKITLPEKLTVLRYYCSLHGTPEGGMNGALVAASDATLAGFDGGGDGSTSLATTPPADAAQPDATPSADAAMLAATRAAQTDATVALVVVAIIGMAVAFGLGIMVWLAGRIVPSRRVDV